jgi:hypothetical protein
LIAASVRRAVANLALALGAVAVALGLAEGALRLAGIEAPSFYRVDPDLGDALDPGSEGWWTKEGRTFVRISSAGLRDREHALAKPADTVRIVVLGDSYAEALQVELEQTFWSVMERELAGCPALAGRRVEVLNLGVSGYGTAQELLALRHRGLRYAPDVVLLAFVTGNDVRNNSKVLQRGGRPYATWRSGELVFDMSFLEKPSSRWRTSALGSLYYAARRRSRVLQVVEGGRAALRQRAELASWRARPRPLRWASSPAWTTRSTASPQTRPGRRRGRSPRPSWWGCARSRLPRARACSWRPSARRSRCIPIGSSAGASQRRSASPTCSTRTAASRPSPPARASPS